MSLVMRLKSMRTDAFLFGGGPIDFVKFQLERKLEWRRRAVFRWVYWEWRRGAVIKWANWEVGGSCENNMSGLNFFNSPSLPCELEKGKRRGCLSLVFREILDGGYLQFSLEDYIAIILFFILSTVYFLLLFIAYHGYFFIFNHSVICKPPKLLCLYFYDPHLTFHSGGKWDKSLFSLLLLLTREIIIIIIIIDERNHYYHWR